MRSGFALAIAAFASLLDLHEVAAQECNADDPPSYDGRCNNLDDIFKGADFSDENPNGVLLRTDEMKGYVDTTSFTEPRPTSDFNPRIISDALIKTPDLANPTFHHANLMTTFFGQFLSHDMVRTVFDFPPLDQQADLIDDPEQEITGFTKMVDIVPTKASIVDDYKEQRNGVSAVLDLNHIYGNDAEVAALLRDGSGGRLLTSSVTTEFTWFPNNHRDFRLCNCVNVTSGEPWHRLDDVNNANIYEIQRESLDGFTPEPFVRSLQELGISQPCYSFASFCLPPEGKKFLNADSPECQNNGPPVNFPIGLCTPPETEDPNIVPEPPFPGIAIPPAIKPAFPFGVCFEPPRRLEDIVCDSTNTSPEYSQESKWVIPEGRDWPPRGDEAEDVPFDT